jgi:hypothetical protein
MMPMMASTRRSSINVKPDCFFMGSPSENVNPWLAR